MNDIDFLPQWYIENRQRRQSVQRQYVILASLFLVMIVWNSLALRSIKRVSGELLLNESQQHQAERVSFEYQALLGKINQVEETVLSLEKLDSRVDMAAVLAELSVLVKDHVVLQKAEFLSLPYGQKRSTGIRPGPETDVLSSENLVQQFSGWSQINVSLQGMAETPGDVAELIRALEGSSYFSEVHLKYSQHVGKTSHAPASGTAVELPGPREGVEFGVDCLLAHLKCIDKPL